MMQNQRIHREGWAIIYALVVLAVLSAMMAIATQNVASARRVLANRANQLQSQWLARAGLELAIDQLRTNTNFKGEAIELIPNSRVVITVAIEGISNGQQVTSEGQFTGINGATSKSIVTKSIRK